MLIKYLQVCDDQSKCEWSLVSRLCGWLRPNIQWHDLINVIYCSPPAYHHRQHTKLNTLNSLLSYSIYVIYWKENCKYRQTNVYFGNIYWFYTMSTFARCVGSLVGSRSKQSSVHQHWDKIQIWNSSLQ